MLRYVSTSQMPTETLQEAFRAFSGRLSLVEGPGGSVSCDYCTGQYFPTEYRAAACAVLSTACWDYWRTDFPISNNIRKDILKRARRIFGRGIASRWF
jgi:hypothetical protein